MRITLACLLVVGFAPSAVPQEAAKGAATKAACRDAVACFAECDQGNASSCETVGGMFEHGIGVEQNLEKADHFYKEACRGGSKRACRKRNALSASSEATEKKVATAPAARPKQKESPAAKPLTIDEEQSSSSPCTDRCKRAHTKCVSRSQKSETDSEGAPAASSACDIRLTQCTAKCQGILDPANSEEAGALMNLDDQ